MRHEPTSAAASIAPILTKDEIAQLLRVHPRTVERLVHAGHLPAGRRLGRQVRWLREDVLGALGSGLESGAETVRGRRESSREEGAP